MMQECMEMGGVYVTRHGYDRMKERMGLNKNAARRMSQRAFENGLSIDSVSGSLLSYMALKDELYPENNIIKIYGEAVYCYNVTWIGQDESTSYVALVTVYPLPKKFNNQALGHQRRLKKQA